MVQCYVAVIAAFIQLVLLAQISSGLPIPSAQVLSNHQVHLNQRLFKRGGHLRKAISKLATKCVGALRRRCPARHSRLPQPQVHSSRPSTPSQHQSAPIHPEPRPPSQHSVYKPPSLWQDHPELHQRPATSHVQPPPTFEEALASPPLAFDLDGSSLHVADGQTKEESAEAMGHGNDSRPQSPILVANGRVPSSEAAEKSAEAMGHGHDSAPHSPILVANGYTPGSGRPFDEKATYHPDKDHHKRSELVEAEERSSFSTRSFYIDELD